MVGMFSSIDVLLNREMKTIVEELPFTQEVKDALLGNENPINNALNVIVKHEHVQLNELDLVHPIQNISQSRFMELYIEAITWVKNND
jgi:EAL and modified HD-GYP domain-containing signal transduction protein